MPMAHFAPLTAKRIDPDRAYRIARELSRKSNTLNLSGSLDKIASFGIK
jgi:hypothetical protein